MIFYYKTMEPMDSMDSPIGSLIHQIMIGRIKIDNKVIVLLFVADRLDHLLNNVNEIVPKIYEVVTGYYRQILFYHSIDMLIDWGIKENEECKNMLKPTAIIFIGVDSNIVIERSAKSQFHEELFEKSRLVKVREK